MEELMDRFNRAEHTLQEMNFETVNPIRVVVCENLACVARGEPESGPGLHSWRCYMRYNIMDIVSDCDKICMLPAWTESKGARTEYQLAEALGFEFFFANEDGTLRDG